MVSVEELELRLRAAARSSPGSPEHVEALNGVAWEIALRDTERARRLALEARTHAEAIDDRRGGALALRTLGYCHLMFSELAEGIDFSRRAAEELRELGDAAGEATALNTLGVLYSRLGDFDKALEFALECLRLNREAGDARGEAWAHVEMGNVHYAVGEYADARESFEEALARFHDIGYEMGTSRTLTLLGNTLENLGETEEALRHFEESLSRARAEGFSLGTAGNASAIGRLHHRAGDLDRAREYYERALEEAKAVTVREMRADVLLRLAALDLETGRTDGARARLDEARRLLEGSGLKRAELRLMATSSSLHEHEGDLAAALADYKAFHALHEEIFSEEGRARLRNLQIRSAIEHAEKEAEIQRLRFVELAGMQARLVQAEKMGLLGRLVAGLSHELNNPIGVVSANASLASRALELALGALGEETLDKLGNDPQWTKSVDTLRVANARTAQAAGRVADLVRSLKSFSRLDEAERARIDPSRCLADAARLFTVDLPNSIALVEDLEPLREISCRPAQLNQAFMTLLANAREAIDGEGRITVRSRLDGDVGSLEVSDTGRGIPPERLSTLFDFDFTRKQSHVRFRMGLAHAKQVFEEHGGGIDVESEVGVGTTLRVRLPLASAPG